MSEKLKIKKLIKKSNLIHLANENSYLFKMSKKSNNKTTPVKFTDLATDLINKKNAKKNERDIWGESNWKHISFLEKDDVGGVGEQIIYNFCKLSSIPAQINGVKTKQVGGGIGDGFINGRSCEIKTARMGSSAGTFQHELGVTPWKAEFMIFLDIAPKNMFVTIFQNFSEEFYHQSGADSSIKCVPYFPTRSITWRSLKGAFKLDTTYNLNSTNEYTFKIDDTTVDYSKFKTYVESIIPPK